MDDEKPRCVSGVGDVLLSVSRAGKCRDYRTHMGGSEGRANRLPKACHLPEKPWKGKTKIKERKFFVCHVIKLIVSRSGK